MIYKCIHKLSFLVFCLLLIFCISDRSLSQTISKDVRDALELCYNFKWDQAEQIFSSMIDENPQKPEGYHFLSGIYLWYYLGNREKSAFNNFVKHSDKAVDILLSELDEAPLNGYLNNLLGSNYMYRAIAFTREENYLDAVWAIKKSETYLSTALEINPKLTDAYLGLGLYNFAVGQIPSAFQWALSLAGIKGDKQLGIDYIKKAATQGTLVKVEAQYYLSQILSEVLFEDEAALYYLQKLTRKYPENLLFNYSYAVLGVKERNLGEAQKVLSKIVNLSNSRFRQIISFSNFLMGDVFFRKNLFDSAKVYYSAFLKSAPANDYTGIANYRLALSYELTDDRKNAEKYFNACGIGNMDLEDDQFAKRKGDIYSERMLSSNEKSLIVASNLIEAGKYQVAYDSLKTILIRAKSESLKAETLLNLSESSYMLNKFDESLTYALEAKEINLQDEKWINPYAVYYAARVYQRKNDQENFADMIEQADGYTDFDYQNKLKNLIFSLKVKNNRSAK